MGRDPRDSSVLRFQIRTEAEKPKSGRLGPPAMRECGSFLPRTARPWPPARPSAREAASPSAPPAAASGLQLLPSGPAPVPAKPSEHAPSEHAPEGAPRLCP
ncbi:hypothetical protein P7K49_020318 [Saguinus oedipus]|uniref:Uncharacterized protein n=1 Tax=Saguinus oedipus TaxID=9490 RepID=A0ABQ9V0K1_SAGOE|nr:hypothetical protein P7K49_020318 [Saguinus oedipus]